MNDERLKARGRYENAKMKGARVNAEAGALQLTLHRIVHPTLGEEFGRADYDEALALTKRLRALQAEHRKLTDVMRELNELYGFTDDE
jgi:hypothetical protein